MEATVFAQRYRVIRRLGSGGTATVFLARDVRLEREVAVKRVHGAEVTAVTAQRLWREARIMASLRHPNLVPIYDIVTEDDDLLLVMEYVRGETLADVLASAPLDWERTRSLLDPVAAALDYVHGEGVVHRDLKPSNILVGAGGTVKVADLGLATAAEITKITPPGAIMGTPAYMAPEQARPGATTPAADVYALATIAFEALSGSLPRWGRTVVAILSQATHEPPADLREHSSGTPDAVAEALIRAMSPIPEARQASASELLHELDAGFRVASIADERARPVTEDRDRAWPAGDREEHPRVAGHRRPPPAVALGTLAVAVAAIIGLMALLSKERASDVRPQPSTVRAQATQTPEAERSATATPTPTHSAAAIPSATPTRTPTPTPATRSAARRRLSPTSSVRAFYRRAAAGDYEGAWSLAGPGMRRAFGNSLSRFRRDLTSLQAIRFDRVAITARDANGVTVEIESVATHSDRVDRCTGTLRTVRGEPGTWLVEPAGVRCSSS